MLFETCGHRCGLHHGQLSVLYNAVNDAVETALDNAWNPFGGNSLGSRNRPQTFAMQPMGSQLIGFNAQPVFHVLAPSVEPDLMHQGQGKRGRGQHQAFASLFSVCLIVSDSTADHGA